MQKIILSLVASFALFAGIAFAQEEESLPGAGITPGSRFFFIERLSENVGTFFTFGEASKTRRMVKLAEERLSEAQTLADRGDANSKKATELYEEQFSKASKRAQKSQNSEALARVTEATSKHFAVLENVIEKVPEEAKASIEHALENSKQGQVTALQKLSEVNPDRAVEAGANAAKTLISQVKNYATEKRSENFTMGIEHFGRIFNSFAPATEGNTEAAAQFSERITDVVNELGDAKVEAENAGIAGSKIIEEVKDVVINTQLSTLRDVVRKNPERAVQIYSRVAERSLQHVQKNTGTQEGTLAKEGLSDFNKYSEFGQQISQMAKDIRPGDTSIQDLVKQATSHHTEILENVRQELPTEARKEFQRAVDNSQRVQNQRPLMPLRNQEWAQPTNQPFQKFEEKFQERQNTRQQEQMGQGKQPEMMQKTQEQRQESQMIGKPNQIGSQMENRMENRMEQKQQMMQGQQGSQQSGQMRPEQKQMQQQQQPMMQKQEQQPMMQQQSPSQQPSQRQPMQEQMQSNQMQMQQQPMMQQQPTSPTGSFSQPSGGGMPPPPSGTSGGTFQQQPSSGTSGGSYSPPPSGGSQPPPPPPPQ